MTEIPIFEPADGICERSMQESFPYFLQVLWYVTGISSKASLSEIELDMAHYTQTGPRLRGILAFRGIGKTHQDVCAFATWRLYTNHDERIKIISKSAGHAQNAVSQIREWLGSVFFLQHLQPDPTKRHRDKEWSFDIGPTRRTKDPSVMAVGIDGQITGTRATLVLPDDIETPENTKTVSAREWLRKQTSEFKKIATLADNSLGEIMVVGTPHHEETVYNTMEERGYQFRSYPVMLPPGDGDYSRDKVDNLAPIVVRMIEEHESEHGEIDKNSIVPTVPGRFGREKILSEMAEGPIDFSQQFMLIRDLGDDFKFLSLSDLIVPDFDFLDGLVPPMVKWGLSDSKGSTARTDIECIGIGGAMLHRQIMCSDREEWTRISEIVMHIDPSGGGADETAVAVVGSCAGRLWCMAVEGWAGEYDTLNGSSERVMESIADLARRMDCNLIRIEKNFGQEMFAQILVPFLQKRFVDPGSEVDASGKPHGLDHSRGWRCSVESLPAESGTKEKRIINALAPIMGAHRLIVHKDAIAPRPGLPRKYELQYQLSAITPRQGSLKHDDRVEALAAAVSYFRGRLDADPDTLEQRLKEERFEEELQEHYRLMGGSPKVPKFFEIEPSGSAPSLTGW